MKRLKLPQNKLARLVINIVFIPFWFLLTFYPLTWINYYFLESLETYSSYEFYFTIKGWIEGVILLIPIGFVTRYIWFKKSRNRIFFGLFDNLKKYQPRIYTTSSNADELKKYAELKDQGIITEEEFQAKKKQILGL